MAKSSSGRRARAERDRVLAVASRLFKARAYADAIAPLTEAARLAPNDGGVLNDLGLAYLYTRRIPEALATLRRSIPLLPGGRPYHNLGLALQEAGDDDAAIAAYRHAVALSPELDRSHGRLGDLLWEKGSRAEAAASYARASELAPGTPFARLCKAMALYGEERYPEAEEVLRALAASDPSNGRAHWRLASLLKEIGHFDEAIESFERSIAVAPWESSAYYGLVSSRKLGEADRPKVAEIVSRIEAKDWPFPPVMAERHRMTLHFAAGKAKDDLGDHEGAMHHFGAANEIHARVSPLDRKAIEDLVDRLVERYSPEFLAEHAAMGGDDATPILIVGMPRSGTTLIERVLSSHPGVRGRGELDFWTERGLAWSLADPGRLAKEAARLRADYLNVLRRDAPDALRATDKMPFNFLWLGLVRLLLPNARFVHCRRNPVDTCLSIHMTPLRASTGFSTGLGDLVWYYRRYLHLMDHWRATIPPSRLLEVDYEEMVAAPEDNARRLVAFSGLEWDPACLRPEENRDGIRTASNWQARQPIYRGSVERWRRYEPWLGELRELLPR